MIWEVVAKEKRIEKGEIVRLLKLDAMGKSKKDEKIVNEEEYNDKSLGEIIEY